MSIALSHAEYIERKALYQNSMAYCMNELNNAYMQCDKHNDYALKCSFLGAEEKFLDFIYFDLMKRFPVGTFVNIKFSINWEEECRKFARISIYNGLQINLSMTNIEYPDFIKNNSSLWTQDQLKNYNHNAINATNYNHNAINATNAVDIAKLFIRAIPNSLDMMVTSFSMTTTHNLRYIMNAPVFNYIDIKTLQE